MAVQITLPDGAIKEFDKEPTVLEVAESIGPRLAKDTLAGIVLSSNEEAKGSQNLVDLRWRVPTGTKLKIVTTKDVRALEVIRHSAAHVMAQAVQEIYQSATKVKSVSIILLYEEL